MTRILRKFAPIAAVIAVSLGAAALTATSAEAAGHGYCVGYAGSAVNQQSRNLASRCGYLGLRWHAVWQWHYDWCRAVSRWRARDEHGLRNGMLDNCGA